mmetsp:Transcript_87383/g.154962  ORF Transcript_87383/g.154962 Transcript_87383/m.154962 type:complete len:590 (+) Transcript_87383:92-1861(+)|eukprot:CAMPEP_0197661614 /NCGR_PEP_ID=MMETSP1338-20131121/51555_1 /TAXON_ID=43686 ORGANISM="Pelagodinium beii, Strain RCC1491" /NCGR_SAMPLE_ID=MMETSP1338 /ASSEMBLY_ACC=CAM_ASM_000754 /LENGTH=589 /DNA_ID=CAMNT_0043239193 /DNA_START=70 /DNA_END=1839 /DNA_ORIENTATION=+
MGALEGLDVPNAKRQKLESDTVTVHRGAEVLEFTKGITAEAALSGAGAKAVAARLDNVIVPLCHAVHGSEVVLEAVPLASADGVRTLVETLKFMLKIAKQDVASNLAVIVGKPIGSAYYCMLSDKSTGETVIPTQELLQKLQSAMQNLIDLGLPMRYMSVACKTAVENLASTGAGFTAKMLKDSNASQIEIVECKGFYHLPQVPLMSSTSMVPKDCFTLSVFKEGFFLEHVRFDSRSGKASKAAQDDLASDILYKEYIGRRRWAQDVDLYTVSQLNSAIRDGKTKKVIQAAEANCDRQFVELAAQVRSRQDVKLVLIAGPSSSGKTTFAKRLQVQLESLGAKPEVLSVDNFYKAWQEITSEGPHKVDWESLDSLNLSQLNEVLLTLLAGKEALIPEYDMKTSTPMDKSHWKKMQLSTRGGGLIIMEGIHCLNPALTSSVPTDQKFRIAIAPIPALQLDAFHVLSGTTIRMLRRMVRDYLNRGRSVLTTLRQWPSIAAGEVHNIYPHQRNADAVMNSEIAYEMCVLKVHVEPLLKQVKPSEPEYSEVKRLLNTLEQFIAMPTNVIPPQSLLREFIGGSWYYDYGGWYKDY